MKRMMKLLVLLLSFLMIFSMGVYAEEFVNKTHRTECVEIKAGSSEFKDKTITRNYTDYNRIPEELPYREFKDNCWWKGTLKRDKLITWDDSNNWNHTTFRGKLYKEECFKDMAMDEDGKDLGEILSVKTEVSIPETAKVGGSSLAEVKIEIPKGTAIPDAYYYEDYSQNLDCLLAGTLSKKKVEEGKDASIVIYAGTMEPTLRMK